MNDRPADGSSYPPCVGCGYCCMLAPCVPSVLRYNGNPDCPALKWDEAAGRYKCAHATEWAKILHIGEGCTSNLNSWRKDVRNRDDQRLGRNARNELEQAQSRQLLKRFRELWPELAHYFTAVALADKDNGGETK